MLRSFVTRTPFRPLASKVAPFPVMGLKSAAFPPLTQIRAYSKGLIKGENTQSKEIERITLKPNQGSIRAIDAVTKDKGLSDFIRRTYGFAGLGIFGTVGLAEIL